MIIPWKSGAGADEELAAIFGILQGIEGLCPLKGNQYHSDVEVTHHRPVFIEGMVMIPSPRVARMNYPGTDQTAEGTMNSS